MKTIYAVMAACLLGFGVGAVAMGGNPPDDVRLAKTGLGSQDARVQPLSVVEPQDHVPMTLPERREGGTRFPSAPGQATFDDIVFKGSAVVIIDYPEKKAQAERVGALAARLGVQPTERPSLGLAGTDGKLYDVVDLMKAMLDRIDDASKTKP